LGVGIQSCMVFSHLKLRGNFNVNFLVAGSSRIDVKASSYLWWFYCVEMSVR